MERISTVLHRKHLLFVAVTLIGVTSANSNAEENANVSPQPEAPVLSSSDSVNNSTSSNTDGLATPLEPNEFEESRDPFSLAGTSDTNGPRGFRFTRQPGGNVPRLSLRGIVLGEENERVGLLQIGTQGVFMVRAGDTVSLRSSGSSANFVINIREISRLSVVVESGTLGEVIIVR